MNVRIERASDADGRSILRLLRDVGLPTEGVAEHLDTAFVGRDGAAIVGCAALEVYPEGALLRSVAVAPAARGRGVGRRLVEAAVASADSLGARSVYLLTNTAETYFSRLGFVRIVREQVPPTVRQSVEFRDVCPASAVVMWRTLHESMQRSRP